MYVVQDLLREIKALSERALDGKYIPWRLSLLCPLTGIWSVRRSRQPRTSVDIRFFIKMYGLWHRRLCGTALRHLARVSRLIAKIGKIFRTRKNYFLRRSIMFSELVELKTFKLFDLIEGRKYGRRCQWARRAARASMRSAKAVMRASWRWRSP